MGQGVNYVTGDYSRGACGFWVENGEIAFPVEEITIAGNLKDMLMGIEAVGADVYNYGAKTVGSILINRMKVAGSEGSESRLRAHRSLERPAVAGQSRIRGSGPAASARQSRLHRRGHLAHVGLAGQPGFHGAHHLAHVAGALGAQLRRRWPSPRRRPRRRDRRAGR